MTASTPAAVIEPPPGWLAWLDALTGNGAAFRALLLHPDDAQQREEAWQLLMSTVSQAYLALFATDPDHPQWVPLFNSGFNIAAPNADTVYQYTPIRDDGVYRIAGNRGTVLQCVLAVAAPFFGLTDKPGPAFDEIDLDDIERKADGEFELILSRERPPGYRGAWRKLSAGAATLASRQVAYDWFNERDAVLTIERLDHPVSWPRLSCEEIQRRAQLMGRWPIRECALWMHLLADMRRAGIVNTLRENRFASIGGLSTQFYYEGLFEIAEDEALILETPVPEKAFYWSVLLTDELFRTIEYTDRQASLNGFQARVDADGHFRAVIAVKDPGVPNWLDTGGHRRGSVQGRWNRCSSHPLPTLKRVPLADVRKHLPSDTPAVTAAERQSALRHRVQGAQRRRRW